MDEDLAAIEDAELQEALRLSLLDYQCIEQDSEGELDKFAFFKTYSDDMGSQASSNTHSENTSPALSDGDNYAKVEPTITKSETLPNILTNSMQFFPVDGDDIPKNWDRTKLSNCGNQRFVELTEDRYEYKEVCKSLGHLVDNGLIEIKRYQNLKLWQKYMVRKKIFLQNQSPEFCLNECFLICQLKKNPKFILESEWNMSKSIGPFGIALYLSDKPLSRRYGKQQHLLLCKVMLGNIKVYPNDTFDPSLTLASQKDFHHSIKGCISGIEEYVIHDMSQVYPEYLITICPPEVSFKTKFQNLIKSEAGIISDSHEENLKTVRKHLLNTKTSVSTTSVFSVNTEKVPTNHAESSQAMSTSSQNIDRLRTLFNIDDKLDHLDFSNNQNKSGIQMVLDDLLQITGLDPIIGRQYLELAEYDLGEALEYSLYSLLHKKM